ncbi:hypothetical protein BaRGS_00025343 [Batillaria attramentaria]|uniref:Uncharacterized protein n=1 Tax=Batillaria attramentaria TaxID=370345 RepID=A0ABD0K8L7_9CAEN
MYQQHDTTCTSSTTLHVPAARQRERSGAAPHIPHCASVSSVWSRPGPFHVYHQISERASRRQPDLPHCLNSLKGKIMNRRRRPFQFAAFSNCPANSGRSAASSLGGHSERHVQTWPPPPDTPANTHTTPSTDPPPPHSASCLATGPCHLATCRYSTVTCTYTCLIFTDLRRTDNLLVQAAIWPACRAARNVLSHAAPAEPPGRQSVTRSVLHLYVNVEVGMSCRQAVCCAVLATLLHCNTHTLTQSVQEKQPDTTQCRQRGEIVRIDCKTCTHWSLNQTRRVDSRVQYKPTLYNVWEWPGGTVLDCRSYRHPATRITYIHCMPYQPSSTFIQARQIVVSRLKILTARSTCQSS